VCCNIDFFARVNIEVKKGGDGGFGIEKHLKTIKVLCYEWFL